MKAKFYFDGDLNVTFKTNMPISEFIKKLKKSQKRDEFFIISTEKDTFCYQTKLIKIVEIIEELNEVV